MPLVRGLQIVKQVVQVVGQAFCLGWSEANIALVDPWLSIRVDVVKELDHHRVRRGV